jgi:hypothetical protein
MNKNLSLEEALRKGNPLNFEELKQATGLNKKGFNDELQRLKKAGVPIQAYLDENTYSTYFYISKGPIPSKNYSLNLKDGNYLMAVEGDDHIGDKGYDHNAKCKFYNILDDRGCKLSLNAGDLVTGVDVYKNQHVDLNIHTKMDQAQWYVDNVPELTNGETLIIDGNHDVKGMENSFSPGYFIGENKNHYRYLGQISADINLASGLVARLIHLKGAAYSKGYVLQKYIRNLNPMDMPNMIFKGHSHDYLYAVIQNIHCLHTGTFQHGISNFCKELGFTDEIGAWIIEYDIEGGKLKRFVPELIKF